MNTTQQTQKHEDGRDPALRVAIGSVQGFWRSARGENHGRDSQPGDVWVSPGDITDSDRLRWLHTGGGRDAEILRESSASQNKKVSHGGQNNE